MAEEPTPVAPEVTPAETPAADPTPVEQTTPEPSAQPAAEPEKGNDPAPEAPKPEKPQSRRSAAYRLQQVLDENRALKQQLGTPPENGTPPAEDINAMVQSAIKKALEPYQSATTKAADDAELAELYSSRPEAKAHEAKLREMWGKPQYKDLAASDLLKIADYDSLVERTTKQAIEEYKAAQTEAKKSSTGGNSSSNRSGKGKSVTEMTPEEFAEHNAQVMSKL